MLNSLRPRREKLPILLNSPEDENYCVYILVTCADVSMLVCGTNNLVWLRTRRRLNAVKRRSVAKHKGVNAIQCTEITPMWFAMEQLGTTQTPFRHSTVTRCYVWGVSESVVGDAQRSVIRDSVPICFGKRKKNWHFTLKQLFNIMRSWFKKIKELWCLMNTGRCIH